MRAGGVMLMCEGDRCSSAGMLAICAAMLHASVRSSLHFALRADAPRGLLQTVCCAATDTSTGAAATTSAHTTTLANPNSSDFVWQRGYSWYPDTPGQVCTCVACTELKVEA